MLMAAMVGGLSFAVTSCKDDEREDDKDNGGGTTEQQMESTGGEVSLTDIQLSTLISNFAEVSADELLETGGWKSKTYEATLGTVIDESRPTVRTIGVGTLEAADERAGAMLRELGIDGNNPSGFTFSDAQVGTVSYQHGGGTDANTLAVINISVRQLPGISQLRMVKEMPANEGTFGYYGRGDIVQKDGRLWICTRPATNRGDYAYFVSFWTTHRTDNCQWGTYHDYVYLAKDQMASETDLISWLHSFVMSQEGYDKVLRCLSDKGIVASAVIEQLLPPTDNIRRELIKRLHFKLDSLPVAPLTMTDWIERNKWGDTPKANGRYCAPRSMLLANKFRYAISPCEYWVPFVGWATREEAVDIQIEIKEMKTQNAKTNGNHFQYAVSSVEEIPDNQTKQDYNNAQKCQYLLAAVYWTHNYYNGNQWAMFDFTKDWNDKEDVNNLNIEISPWLSRNIVSSTLKFKDNGGPNASVQKLWVAREDAKQEDDDNPNKIQQDEVKLYSIIGTNGKFYDNVNAATNDGTQAMAIVTYLGGNKRAEHGKAWNGLAMALDKLNQKYQFIDDNHTCENCTPETFELINADEDFTGWATTQTLVGGCGEGHDHKAAKACNSYGTNLQMTDRQSEFSSWFLPSFGQWAASVQAMGGVYYLSANAVEFHESVTMEEGFKAAGAGNLYEFIKWHQQPTDENSIWTSTTTAEDKHNAYAFQIALNYDYNNASKPKFEAMNVIPFIAFKYGGGGTTDD
jgi:hypothetical protein